MIPGKNTLSLLNALFYMGKRRLRLKSNRSENQNTTPYLSELGYMIYPSLEC